MCYNISIRTREDVLIQRFNTKFRVQDLFTKDFGTFINGYAHPLLPIIKSESPDTISLANWGLIPRFTKNKEKADEISKMTLNAKSETIFEKQSFMNSIPKQRCLIPVNGFFEWMHLGKEKYPYFIKLKEHEIFSLGGIYDTWIDKDTGESITSFSIVTTAANPLMAKIHNSKKRMPLIFTQEDEKGWIDGRLTESLIENMMQPLDEKFMLAYTVKKIAPAKVDRNDESILQEVEYPELQLL
jgi:putative SOS response-associated peptidase YedK